MKWTNISIQAILWKEADSELMFGDKVEKNILDKKKQDFREML